MQNRPPIVVRALFNVKLSDEERRYADLLAEHYGEAISVIVRRLIKEHARSLGYVAGPIPPAASPTSSSADSTSTPPPVKTKRSPKKRSAKTPPTD